MHNEYLMQNIKMKEKKSYKKEKKRKKETQIVI